MQGMKLEKCINATTCVPRAPKVARVERGVSANVFVDNGAYRNFLSTKFNVTPIDMESAAVALICYQQKIPFIAIRSLSDLAGGGSAISNEASTFAPLAAQNAVAALIKLVPLLSSSRSFFCNFQVHFWVLIRYCNIYYSILQLVILYTSNYM